MNHQNQNMDWMEPTPDLEHSTPAQVRRSTRRKQTTLRRLVSLTLSAVLFGTVSAGTFYGVNTLLPQDNSSTASVSAGSAGGVLTSLASTSYASTRYGMDVSDIAAAALLNLDGELVGINTAKLSDTDVEGMGYAIPISDVVELIS